MSEFRMPSLGADMESGTLIEWLVKPGDEVHRGDIVAVVETDKGAIEVEIFENAVIAELLVPPDTLVPVGTPLARLEAAGAVTPSATPRRVAPSPPAPQPPSVAASRPAQRPAPSPPSALVHTGAPGPIAGVGRRKLSPAARKHAREHGIDLDTVVGTGHGGVVTVADVERAFAASGTTPPPPSPVAPATSSVQARAMRRSIAASMSRAKREIPHYYLAHSLDVEPALAWLERRNAERPLSERVLPGVLLIKAVARALPATPTLNGWWTETGFQLSAAIHLGVAVAQKGGGLVAPAIRDADRSSLDELMSALRDVTQRVRAGRLKSSEMSSATITVSSLGDGGVDTVFPIIHPPQVAIVGFGAVTQRPWVVAGGLHVRRVVTATLAADHRASDGHVGARFLKELERQLSKPEEL